MSESAIDKLPEKDRPYTSNYPPLQAWLDKVDARCLSQVQDGYDYVERWQVNGRVFVVVIHAKRQGWDIYTSSDGNKVFETLADAASRLGIEEKP